MQEQMPDNEESSRRSSSSQLTEGDAESDLGSATLRGDSTPPRSMDAVIRSRETLRFHYSVLRKTLTVDGDMLAALYSKGVISSEEMNAIKGLLVAERPLEGAEKLLGWLTVRGSLAFDIFCGFLEQSLPHNQELAQTLRQTWKSISLTERRLSMPCASSVLGTDVEERASCMDSSSGHPHSNNQPVFLCSGISLTERRLSMTIGESSFTDQPQAFTAEPRLMQIQSLFYTSQDLPHGSRHSLPLQLDAQCARSGDVGVEARRYLSQPPSPSNNYHRHGYRRGARSSPQSASRSHQDTSFSHGSQHSGDGRRMSTTSLERLPEVEFSSSGHGHTQERTPNRAIPTHGIAFGAELRNGHDDNAQTLQGSLRSLSHAPSPPVNPRSNPSQSEPPTPSRPRESTLRSYKVALLGDSAVGKTAFMHSTEPLVNRQVTIGFGHKVFNFTQGQTPVQLTLYDTAGMEKFNAIAKSYLRRCDGFIMMYDVTRRETCEHVKKWHKFALDLSGRDNPPILVLGNKVDEIAKRIVQEQDGEKIASKLNAQHHSGSALKPDDFYQAIEILTWKLLDTERSDMEQLVALEDGRVESSNCCSCKN